jgi:integrase
MARSINRLTAIGITAIRKKGRYADGGGLYLRVSPALSKSWVFRWVRHGKATEIGLGAFPEVSLAQARKVAFEARQQLAVGKNPKKERDRIRSYDKSFGEVAEALLASKASGWKNEKTPHQWRRDLFTISSSLRDLPVSEIETSDILKLLEPIWETKSESAAKLRMRLEALLDYAKARGWREGENPARWRGHLANILPPRKILTRGHHPAMAYSDLPAFWKRLNGMEALTARALELLILTATRTSEVLKSPWDEFDLDNGLWVIPAGRMKAKRDHRIPLTSEAVEILEPLFENKISEYVFPGRKHGKPLSDMSMAMLLRRMKVKTVTVHGFRSSFRDWCGDETSFPREIAEAALAHKVGSDVEQAYRRGDALEKRRLLMQAWAEYCTGARQGKVVSLHA